MLSLSLTAFYENAEAIQGTTAPTGLSQACLNELGKVTPPLPTVKEMLNVDPIKTPWGINLDLVDEFRHRFRNTKGLGDACNFAARITLYQKHKSIAKKLAEEYSAKIKEPKKSKELQEEIAALREKMDSNNIMLKNFAAKIRSQIGLKAEQIAKLPDLDTWNAKKQAAQQTLAPTRPKTPTPVKRGLSFPPDRPLSRVPQEKPNF
jgi:hypothetical protein